MKLYYIMVFHMYNNNVIKKHEFPLNLKENSDGTVFNERKYFMSLSSAEKFIMKNYISEEYTVPYKKHDDFYTSLNAYFRGYEINYCIYYEVI